MSSLRISTGVCEGFCYRQNWDDEGNLKKPEPKNVYDFETGEEEAYCFECIQSALNETYNTPACECC